MQIRGECRGPIEVIRLSFDREVFWNGREAFWGMLRLVHAFDSENRATFEP